MMEAPRTGVISAQGYTTAELPLSVQKRISEGRELSFTLPENIYIRLATPCLKDDLKGTPPGTEKNAIYLLMFRGIIEKAFNSVFSAVKLDQFTPEERNIANVVHNVFKKLNHSLPCPFTESYNASITPDTFYAIDYQQAKRFVEIAEHLNKLTIGKNSPPIYSSEPQSTPTITIPKVLRTLSGAPRPKIWAVLENLSKGAIAQDEFLTQSIRKPSSATGWTVYITENPSIYICGLPLKNPQAILMIADTLKKSGFEAYPLTFSKEKVFALGLLLSSSDIQNDLAYKALMEKSSRANQAIAESFKTY